MKTLLWIALGLGVLAGLLLLSGQLDFRGGAAVPSAMYQDPAGLCSWTKMRLGWIDPAKVALVTPWETVVVRLDPLSDPDSATLAIKIPLTADTYYLVGNRQAINSDVNLPSSGVMVLYADDTVRECRNRASPVKAINANPEIAYLMGAAFGLEGERVFVDAEHNVAIVLLEKADLSYDILITTPVVAGQNSP